MDVSFSLILDALKKFYIQLKYRCYIAKKIRVSRTVENLFEQYIINIQHHQEPSDDHLDVYEYVQYWNQSRMHGVCHVHHYQLSVW